MLYFRLETIEPGYGYRGEGSHQQGCQGTLPCYRSQKLVPSQDTEISIAILDPQGELPSREGAPGRSFDLDQWVKVEAMARKKKGSQATIAEVSTNPQKPSGALY